jgi:hypothetical protein
VTDVTKRGRNILSALALTLMATLAFSALAAGSAQAHWYINEEAFNNYTGTRHWEKASGGYNPGSFEMVVPAKNAKIACKSSGNGYGEISEGTKLYDPIVVSQCQVTEIKTGKPVLGCSQVEPLNLTLRGTGASVETVGESKLILNEECGIGVKVAVKIESLALTFDPEESWLEGIRGAGSGLFGTKPATFTTSEILYLPNGSPIWSWH